MTVLLPFIEHQDIYNAMDLTKSYRDTTAGNKLPRHRRSRRPARDG